MWISDVVGTSLYVNSTVTIHFFSPEHSLGAQILISWGGANSHVLTPHQPENVNKAPIVHNTGQWNVVDWNMHNAYGEYEIPYLCVCLLCVESDLPALWKSIHSPEMYNY